MRADKGGTTVTDPTLFNSRPVSPSTLEDNGATSFTELQTFHCPDLSSPPMTHWLVIQNKTGASRPACVSVCVCVLCAQLQGQ